MTDPGSRRLRVLLWHVHGSWTDAFVRGRHHYLLPVSPDGPPWGAPPRRSRPYRPTRACFAALAGKNAREHALKTHGLDAFLATWDHLLAETAR